jgi:hypothetical protein
MEMRISAATPAARSWLNSSRDCAVLHVFSAACNLVDSGGSVLSLVRRRDSISPFSMLVTGSDGSEDGVRFDEWLDVDSPIGISSTELWVGDIKFSLNRARVWNPKVAWDDIRPDRVMSTLPVIEDILRSVAPTGSFFDILGNGNLTELQTVAKSAWHNLRSGIQGFDESVLIGSVQSLAGLGEGLTPAGDDFLLGVIYSLRIMGEASAQAIINLIVTEAMPRTTRLSAAWLAAAGSGEAGIMWHWFLETIQSGNKRGVTSLSRRIAEVGHTSGADALAGFLATSRLLGEQSPSR